MSAPGVPVVLITSAAPVFSAPVVQVRVIIWRTRDVINGDELTDQSDLFVKAWMEDGSPQKTDTHLRAKNGVGSFNYRMIFPAKFPLKTEPIMHLQIWDFDLAKYNDCLAETELNLAQHLKQCVDVVATARHLCRLPCLMALCCACVLLARRVYRTGKSVNLFLNQAKIKKRERERQRRIEKQRRRKKRLQDDEFVLDAEAGGDDSANPRFVLTESRKEKPQTDSRMTKVIDSVGTRFRRGSAYNKQLVGRWFDSALISTMC